MQDESSQLAVRVLDPKKGDKILDMCAAPGGKSFTIAERDETRAVAFRDIYAHKIDLMQEGAERLGISIMQCRVKDAAAKEESPKRFDRVHADVPCSGLGLWRKKPVSA